MSMLNRVTIIKIIKMMNIINSIFFDLNSILNYSRSSYRFSFRILFHNNFSFKRIFKIVFIIRSNTINNNNNNCRFNQINFQTINRSNRFCFREHNESRLLIQQIKTFNQTRQILISVRIVNTIIDSVLLTKFFMWSRKKKISRKQTKIHLSIIMTTMTTTIILRMMTTSMKIQIIRRRKIISWFSFWKYLSFSEFVYTAKQNFFLIINYIVIYVNVLVNQIFSLTHLWKFFDKDSSNLLRITNLQKLWKFFINR